uniref:Uncharacterized protein n=1 Tax=Pinctada fucata TaxID=50426 RepID=A0A194AQ31_PINFU
MILLCFASFRANDFQNMTSYITRVTLRGLKNMARYFLKHSTLQKAIINSLFIKSIFRRNYWADIRG